MLSVTSLTSFCRLGEEGPGSRRGENKGESCNDEAEQEEGENSGEVGGEKREATLCEEKEIRRKILKGSERT